MNYTYQSFNFRNRQGAHPFYDLVASIAAEEFGHITMFGSCGPRRASRPAEPPPSGGHRETLDQRRGTWDPVQAWTA